MKILLSSTDFVRYIYEVNNSDDRSVKRSFIMYYLIYQLFVLILLLQVIHVIWWIYCDYDLQQYKEINPLFHYFFIVVSRSNPFYIRSLIPVYLFFFYINHFLMFSFYKISVPSMRDSYFLSFFTFMSFKQCLKYDTSQIYFQSSPFKSLNTFNNFFMTGVISTYISKYITIFSSKYSIFCS